MGFYNILSLEHCLWFGKKNNLLCMNGKTCNDINKGQDVKKVMRIFLWFMNENISYFVIIKKYKLGL